MLGNRIPGIRNIVWYFVYLLLSSSFGSLMDVRAMRDVIGHENIQTEKLKNKWLNSELNSKDLGWWQLNVQVSFFHWENPFGLFKYFKFTSFISIHSVLAKAFKRLLHSVFLLLCSFLHAMLHFICVFYKLPSAYICNIFLIHSNYPSTSDRTAD